MKSRLFFEGNEFEPVFFACSSTYRFPGYPSAYLFVMKYPNASNTASLTKFSEAISSDFPVWRCLTQDCFRNLPINFP
jgi:hypothetical protein